MILDRYKITCTKYVWAADTELSKVNIFSDVEPISAQTETIDIKPYMVDISDITWDLDSTDEEDGKSNLFFEESDVTYTLSGLVNNAHLVRFFGLYRDTTMEKYLIQIEDERSGSMIHRGIVSQELIEITYSPAKDSELLKVTAMGYLKEFKAYYSTVPMLHDLQWTRRENLPNVIFNSLHAGHVTWGCTMQSLLQQTFNDRTGINFILEPGVAEWYIIANPCLSKRINYQNVKPDNTCWIKSSYERIRVSGENRFEFIRRLCNAMGWVFYFSDNNFYIKNRSPIETARVLDFNNVMEYTLSKQKEVSEYEHIIILNGAIAVGLPQHTAGWGLVEGERMKIFSSLPTSDWERWWKNIPVDWNLMSMSIEMNPERKVQKFFAQTDNEFTWCFVTLNNIPYLFWEIKNINKFTVKKGALLSIDAGDTKNEAWKIDTGAGNVGKTSPNIFLYDVGEHEIVWKGNYGSAMFKIDLHQHVYTYDEYKDSSNYNNNFLKFFRNNLSRKIKLKYNGVITNPLYKYSFTNDDMQFSGEWVTMSLKLDLKLEVSTIELQYKG